MADYNYLGLVNNINRRLNEVELTSTNFSTAVGWYSQCQDAVNASIRDINQQQYEWPFNHVEQTDTLVAGTTRYPIPSDSKLIDFDSFRIKEDATIGNDTIRLGVATYEDYLKRRVDQEYTTSTTKRDLPKFVFQAPSLEYGVTPAPDAAYELVYEYYCLPVDLELFSDVPSIPEQFRYVIVDGAMYHAYLFRGNSQDASIAYQKFQSGIKSMRSMLINRYVYVTSGMVSRSSITGSSLGSAFATAGSVSDGF
tara:strand:- start:42 stop:800 length:759 start_codon:yes stop_codon:yes gene_type:complete